MSKAPRIDGGTAEGAASAKHLLSLVSNPMNTLLETDLFKFLKHITISTKSEQVMANIHAR
jgi:hypothetical protein